MNSLSDFLNILILLGTIQGFITSVLLFNLKSNKNANRILAWIILLISLACLNIYVLEAVSSTSLFLSVVEAIIPLVIIMPIGPLVYFYVKAILNPEFKLEKHNRPHFYTVLLDFIPNFAVIVFILGGFFGLIKSQSSIELGSFIETYNLYIDIPRWLSLAIYLWYTFKIISNYNNEEKNLVFVKWAKQFIIGFSIFLIIWLIHLVPYIIPSLSNKLLASVGWYPIYIPLIILVYWLGVNGYIISFKTYNKTSKSLNLSEATIKKTIKALEKAMIEDKLYLNSSLKLNDIVRHIEVSQKIISTVLNQHTGKTFNEFINSYRIEEFKSRLLKNNSENLTITGIAFECGFNSQATFQRVFKTVTNLSPREFQQRHLKN